MTVGSYNNIHYVEQLDRATEDDLRRIVQSFPLIDNHAHNLLREEHAHGGTEYPFESITSEATGHALLEHTRSSLAHIRGVNQLAELFQCSSTLDDVKAARYEWIHRDYSSLIEKCFEGTHTVLIDDGLPQESVHPVTWHGQFAPTVSRIVRIEAIAAELLEQLAHTAGLMRPGRDAQWDKDQSEAFLVRFNTVFRNQVRNLAQDSSVRGFKSVVCYRTGLDVELDSRNLFRPHQSLSESQLLSAFHVFLQQAVQTHNYRVEQKEVNDYLVVAACDVLSKLTETNGESVPIQFHTGLGDNDIDLVKANPAYMKSLLVAFPNVDFVLLHASYPYTREAGYMATTFANAWLDIGEIFPMLSRDGQEAAVRQALELTPTSKLLWSTDGHFHPETFYLANRQFREVLEKVLVEYVRAADFSAAQAINIAVDILFWNSNSLYKLDEEHKYPQLLRACGRASRHSIRTSTTRVSVVDSFDSGATTYVDTRRSTILNPPPSIDPSIEYTVSKDTMAKNLAKDVALFDAFMKDNPEVKYIWVTTPDYTGTHRVRMVPVKSFRKMIGSGKYPQMPLVLPNIIQNDTISGKPQSGEFKLVPDMSSIQLNAALPSASATVQVWWMSSEGAPPTEHMASCARWNVQKHIDALQAEFGINIMMGFEIEICFMRPVMSEDGASFVDFQTLSSHSWNALTYLDIQYLPMIEEMMAEMASVGIDISQFHTEAAAGQWEFPLPAHDPIKSVDVLFKARDIIRWVAYKYGLKATLHPRLSNNGPGSACHAHFSVNGAKGVPEKYQDPFLAGILECLPSICAFSLPVEESYARVMPGIWSGGEWVSWGYQNRDVPLRKNATGYWEFRACDGIGNMYLTVAALLGAGLYGLRKNVPLTNKDCTGDPSALSAEQRKELGITAMLPHKLTEALENLDGSKVLREMMGNEIVNRYIAAKNHEIKTFGGLDEQARRTWLIGRY